MLKVEINRVVSVKTENKARLHVYTGEIQSNHVLKSLERSNSPHG